MHQVSDVLDWPTVHDLYPHVGMAADWTKGCTPPANIRYEKSLAAPATGQGVGTRVNRRRSSTVSRSLPKSAQAPIL